MLLILEQLWQGYQTKMSNSSYHDEAVYWLDNRFEGFERRYPDAGFKDYYFKNVIGSFVYFYRWTRIYKRQIEEAVDSLINNGGVIIRSNSFLVRVLMNNNTICRYFEERYGRSSVWSRHRSGELWFPGQVLNYITQKKYSSMHDLKSVELPHRNLTLIYFKYDNTRVPINLRKKANAARKLAVNLNKLESMMVEKYGQVYNNGNP